MTRLFGTDGIRGLANRPPMDPQTVFLAAAAAAQVLQERVLRRGLVRAVIVGRDTRASGPMLEAAAAAGFASCGLQVLRAGVIPTPAVSRLVTSRHLLAGAVISASHNHFADNGLKLFGPGGSKLSDALETEIEDLMELGVGTAQAQRTGKGVGSIADLPEAADEYRRLVRRSVGRLRLDGLTVVVDCGHGAAGEFTPRVLTDLGARVITVNASPDGCNINRRCGSLHPSVARAAVLAHGADLGVSHDGDADRALFVDEKGGLVDGDHVLALCARSLWGPRRRGPAVRKVVSTVMANLGLEVALRELDVDLVRTDVGDRWVKEAMDREGAVLGGEQSGHIIFGQHAPTGDGLLTALEVLSALQRTGLRLSEARSAVVKFPQTLVNVPVSEKPPLVDIPAVRAALAVEEARMGDQGRVLLRYSGTEPLARVMVEGRDGRVIRQAADAIATAIREAIGLGTGRSQ